MSPAAPAAAGAAYYLGWTWDETGKKLMQADFDPIIANCVDPAAAEEMPLRYGVAVNRTALITFPSAHQILDDPVDFDFDYQPIVGLRVNEPVAVFTASADGEYYHIYNSCCSGWVRAEDIALCADRDECLLLRFLQLVCLRGGGGWCSERSSIGRRIRTGFTKSCLSSPAASWRSISRRPSPSGRCF